MGKHSRRSTRKGDKQSDDQRSQLKKASKMERSENKDLAVTMEALIAMSDSDSDGELPPEEEWNKEARSLKSAIESGLFNKLLRKSKSSRSGETGEDDEDSIEEVDLEDDMSEDDGERKRSVDQKCQQKGKMEADGGEIDESENDHDSEDDDEDSGDEERNGDRDDAEHETASYVGNSQIQASKKQHNDHESSYKRGEEEDEDDRGKEEDGQEEEEDDDGQEEEDGKEEDEEQHDGEYNAGDCSAAQEINAGSDVDDSKKDIGNSSGREDDETDDQEQDEEEDERENDDEHLSVKQLNAIHHKALRTEADSILAAQKRLTWPETFDVISTAPLPFGHADEEGNMIDIHDDLKREVSFYNMALEAAIEGRRRCEQANIAFSRPEDFFAEMVKTDEHMAKIKDRLIFENKKIEAVNQRKSNKEQRLRSRESQANRLAEKAKRKKDNLKAVDDWARNAASKRIGGQLSNDFDVGGGRGRDSPNKKRMAADKRYGFGGKKGRFKHTDYKALNDMSGFSSKGSVLAGRKRKSNGSSGGGGTKAGHKRPGKRARDASRSRNK